MLHSTQAETVESDINFLLNLAILFVLILGFSRFLRFIQSYRSKKFFLWAQEHGLKYDPRRNSSQAKQYRFLECMKEGADRHTAYRMKGQWQGFSVDSFAFRFTTFMPLTEVLTGWLKGRPGWRGRVTLTRYVLALELEQSFEEVVVVPKNLWSLSSPYAKGPYLDPDHAAFQKAFTLRCKNEKLAYAFLSEEMMELMLRYPSITVELERNTLALCLDTCPSPSALTGFFDYLVAIRQTMSSNLLKDDAN